MSLPIVAIVGRPNVGKSSLFNALVGRRVSIVEPTPGVTRDRVSDICDEDEFYFELVDTGGYGIDDRDDLTEHVERQIHFAINQATVILFVVDIRDGVVPLDVKMAELLRKHHSRVRLVANKADTPSLSSQGAEFTRLGFGEPLCVSAVHSLGRGELKQEIVERLKRVSETGFAPADPIMKIAIVGRRNTGKSTFINSLAGQERVIVSEVAGTTRDSIDVRFERDGQVFMAIDTAGVRKRSKLADSIEFYAFTRVEKSIERADVVLFLIDSTESVGQVDKKLARVLTDAYKPVVIVVNKWDLAKDRAVTEQYGDYLTKTLGGLDYAPIVFTSAKDNHNVSAAIDTAAALFKQFNTRIGTGQLNQVMETILAERGPSVRKGNRPPRIYYATQVAAAPPTIVLFVNTTQSFTPEYERFLRNRFQEMLPFGEIPIRLMFRARRGGSRAKAEG